jgi:processive 1,2-diacylglycerol beta-glucosyltransferase
VAEARLPVVANGDFHRPEHLATWKTLLPCAKDEEAVVEFLRSGREAGLTRAGREALAVTTARAA